MFKILIPSCFLLSLFRTSSANMNKSRDNQYPCLISFWITQDFVRSPLRITYKRFILMKCFALHRQHHSLHQVIDFTKGPQVALKPFHECFPYHLPFAQALGEEESIVPSYAPAFLKADRHMWRSPFCFSKCWRRQNQVKHERHIASWSNFNTNLHNLKPVGISCQSDWV